MLLSVSVMHAEETLKYITPEAFQEGLRANTIAPNTFYWGNTKDDRTLLPTPQVDGGIPYIGIQGGEAPRVDRASLSSFLYRIIPIPRGKAKTVTLSFETKFEENLWSEARRNINPALDAPSVSVFFSDGKRVCADIPFVYNTAYNSWILDTKTFEIPKDAKYIGFSMASPGGTYAKIRNINIAFE